jgi:hypothetical protein
MTSNPSRARSTRRLRCRGEEVALLVNEVLAPGTYERELNGSTLAAGVYWSRLQVGSLSETRKMMRVK